MSIGRNDPCPCGSGKKYKKCCMGNNVVSIDAMISQELDALQEELLTRFDGSGQEEVFEALASLEHALGTNQFPQSDRELTTAFLMMWIILHEPLKDGKTIIERFIENKENQVRPSVSSLLMQWADTPPSLSRITEINREWAEVEDYLTLEKKKVKLDEEEWPQLEEGHFLLGFLLPYGSYEKYFITFLNFPEEMEDFFNVIVRQPFEEGDADSSSEFMIEIFPSLLKMIFDEEPELIWKDPLYEEAAEIFEEVFIDVHEERQEMGELGVTLWNSYCLQEEPRFRKPEVYAAAIHYFMSEHFPVKHLYTQSELADQYEVSVSSLSNAYRKIAGPFHQVLQGSMEHAVEEEGAAPFHPMAMERDMAALTKALEGREFESEEEFNEFVRGFLNAGNPLPRAETKEDQAQNLVYEASMAPSGKKRRELAEQALKLDKNCIDAYNILGEEAEDPIQALKYFKKGMTIGEKELGPEYFKEMMGSFWGLLETRPYMRAKYHYAMAKESIGDLEEAIRQYEELLQLNEQDNLGVRYQLFDAYVHAGEYEQASALLDEYDESHTAMGAYNQLLIEFLLRGPSSKLEELLHEAKEANPYVIDYLTKKQRLPSNSPPGYSLGSKEEAVIYMKEHGHLWPGEMIDWLKNRE